MKLLLVEDDTILCGLLSKILGFEEIENVIVHDGYTAEDVLLKDDSRSIRLILCDIMMPGMDGYELLRRVKMIPFHKDTPFVFTTARVSKDEELRGLMLGAKAYLKKPIDIATLLDAIRHYMVDE